MFVIGMSLLIFISVLIGQLALRFWYLFLLCNSYVTSSTQGNLCEHYCDRINDGIIKVINDRFAI